MVTTLEREVNRPINPTFSNIRRSDTSALLFLADLPSSQSDLGETDGGPNPTLLHALFISSDPISSVIAFVLLHTGPNGKSGVDTLYWTVGCAVSSILKPDVRSDDPVALPAPVRLPVVRQALLHGDGRLRLPVLPALGARSPLRPRPDRRQQSPHPAVSLAALAQH